MLNQLSIKHVRQFKEAQHAFHPRYNVFYGENGCGKTSLLEAIYMLSTGHSFRTREVLPIITHGETSLTLFARMTTNDTISLQKSANQPTRVKINRHPCGSSSELARWLPTQVIYHEIFHVIDAGPAVRRSLLDWGLFHVKHSYLAVWKAYKHVLKQRNALLRQRASRAQFIPWDTQLVELAYALDAFRSQYVEAWADALQPILAQLTTVSFQVRYYNGWDKRASGKSLSILLDEQFASDCHQQYTHSGAHQADILFDTPFSKAKLSLSRGQQKIILIALKLAQACLLEKPCLFLFDDVASELDARHLDRLMQCIDNTPGQFFFTSLMPNTFEPLINDTSGQVIALSRQERE